MSKSMQLLLVTNFFPPTNSIASFRTFSFASYLPEFGITVDVITPRKPGSLSLDISKIKIHYPIEEENNLRFSSQSNPIKELLKQTGIRAFRLYMTSRFYHRALHYAKNNLSGLYDAIIASYPGEDSLRIGFKLSQFWDIPLIVDYRDLWLQNGYLDWTPLDRIFVRKLEKRINDHASLILTATRGAALKLGQQFGGKVFPVFNGFLDEDYVTQENSPTEKKRQIVFCYTGSLYGGKRPIEWLFPLLQRNKNYHLQIAVLESLDAELVKHLAQKYSVQNQIDLYVALTTAEAEKLEKESDVLVLLNLLSGRGNDVIPAKFFQYLIKNKFILGIGHKDDEVGMIVRDLNAGYYVSAENDLMQFQEHYDAWNIKSRNEIGFYSRKHQAERLAGFISKFIK